MYNIVKSNDNDFIEVGLGGMGYSCRSYKKTIPNYKFIRGQFQTLNFKKKHFTSCNVSKCSYGFQNIEKETIFLKNQCLWNLCVFSEKNLKKFMSFQFHTHVNM